MKIGTTFGGGVYAGNNKPHFNLWDAEKDPKFAGQNVVQDDHMWAQAIWGYEKNLPPYDPKDKGHFHVGTAEWWVIMKGQIRHNIETVGDFTSNEGGCLSMRRRRRGNVNEICGSRTVMPSRPSAAISSRRCWNNPRTDILKYTFFFF